MSVENLDLQPSVELPGISFDASNGMFEISGMSRPEDVTKFYNPVIEWLNKYSKNPVAETTINFKYAYFNTASARKIYELLAVFDELHTAGISKVVINWHYDEPDLDMKMAGEEYDELLELDMNFVSVAID